MVGRAALPLRSALLGALVLSAGCHYVKRDDFQAEIASVRQDMASGDQQVASQVTALESKVDSRMQTLEQQLRTFEEQFSALGARVDRVEGSLRVHTPVSFGFDESTLQTDQTQVLDALAGVLKGGPLGGRRGAPWRLDAESVRTYGQGEQPTERAQDLEAHVNATLANWERAGRRAATLGAARPGAGTPSRA